MIRFFKSMVISLLTLAICSSVAIAQQKNYQPPALTDSNAWTVIMLPDPQTYQKLAEINPFLN